jgi:hypothetical protein
LGIRAEYLQFTNGRRARNNIFVRAGATTAAFQRHWNGRMPASKALFGRAAWAARGPQGRTLLRGAAPGSGNVAQVAAQCFANRYRANFAAKNLSRRRRIAGYTFDVPVTDLLIRVVSLPHRIRPSIISERRSQPQRYLADSVTSLF